MKRRYKLLLIIVCGCLITILLSKCSIKKEKYILALGDSISIGITPYNTKTKTFNDYLSEELHFYLNQEFSSNFFSTHYLKDNLSDNVVGTKTNKPIQQIIKNAQIITIAIGMDELIYLTTNEKIEKDKENVFIENYEKIISYIRKLTDKNIFIISLYPYKLLTNNDVIEINNKLKNLAIKYKTKYIDILAISLNRDYYFKETDYHLNYKAHKIIAKHILNK